MDRGFALDDWKIVGDTTEERKQMEGQTGWARVD
jgi:hypothetical protein